MTFISEFSDYIETEGKIKILNIKKLINIIIQILIPKLNEKIYFFIEKR